MGEEVFQSYLDKYNDVLQQIQQDSHDVHDRVNQNYGVSLPYSYHLDHVAGAACKYGHLVCQCEDDVLPLIFSAYYHDSIEDARYTYHDVQRDARQYMTEEQVTMAAEIVYALTNEKGRTRAERANERYFAGIRTTPYAPFVKLCDRFANVVFSSQSCDYNNVRMKMVYAKEMPGFIEAIRTKSTDSRLLLPEEMITDLLAVLH